MMPIIIDGKIHTQEMHFNSVKKSKMKIRNIIDDSVVQNALQLLKTDPIGSPEIKRYSGI